jgi:hypothetical protein
MRSARLVVAAEVLNVTKERKRSDSEIVETWRRTATNAPPLMT